MVGPGLDPISTWFEAHSLIPKGRFYNAELALLNSYNEERSPGKSIFPELALLCENIIQRPGLGEKGRPVFVI